jgi:hypothetical protein
MQSSHHLKRCPLTFLAKPGLPTVPFNYPDPFRLGISKMISTGWDKVLRVILLLASRLRKCSNPSQDASDHEEKRYDGPNDTPALGRSPVSLRKDAGVGAVYFAEDEIITLLDISKRKPSTTWSDWVLTMSQTL